MSTNKTPGKNGTYFCINFNYHNGFHVYKKVWGITPTHDQQCYEDNNIFHTKAAAVVVANEMRKVLGLKPMTFNQKAEHSKSNKVTSYQDSDPDQESKLFRNEMIRKQSLLSSTKK